MTVTDLDPPRTQLHLISSTGSSPGRDRRYRAGALLGREARALFREVLQSALESGSPIDPDALRVVLAAKQANHPGPIRHFTSTAIWQLMFVDVAGWCRARQLSVPNDAVKALSATIDHLATTDTFALDSDGLNSLCVAIDECTGGWPDSGGPPLPTRRPGSVRSQRGPKRT